MTGYVTMQGYLFKSTFNDILRNFENLWILGIKESESVGKVVVNRSCRGNIAFDEVKTDGSLVILVNNTKGRSGKVGVYLFTGTMLLYRLRVVW